MWTSNRIQFFGEVDLSSVLSGLLYRNEWSSSIGILNFRTWEERPAACIIDIGVTSDHKTILVECNDAYSSGDYGLEDFKYARFISARWAQIFEREDPFDFRKYQP